MCVGSNFIVRSPGGASTRRAAASRGTCTASKTPRTMSGSAGARKSAACRSVSTPPPFRSSLSSVFAGVKISLARILGGAGRSGGTRASPATTRRSESFCGDVRRSDACRSSFVPSCGAYGKKLGAVMTFADHASRSAIAAASASSRSPLPPRKTDLKKALPLFSTLPSPDGTA